MNSLKNLNRIYTATFFCQTYHTKIIENPSNLLLQFDVGNFSGLALHLVHLMVGHVEIGLKVLRHHDQSEDQDGNNKVKSHGLKLFRGHSVTKTDILNLLQSFNKASSLTFTQKL